MTHGYPRWAGTEPQEADPDLDDLTRAELADLPGPAAVVAEVLDQWVRELHGVQIALKHGAGLFLDLLAAAGHRVSPIDPVPSLDQLLPLPKDRMDMQDLYAQIGEPTEWCLVQSYPDRSAVIAAWGPFASEQKAKDAIPSLRHVVDNVTLDVVPFRRITPGRPHKPGIRGELTVHSSGRDTG